VKQLPNFFVAIPHKTKENQVNEHMMTRPPLKLYQLIMLIMLSVLAGGLKNTVQAQHKNPGYQSVIQKFLGTTDTSRIMRITHEFVIPKNRVINKSIVVEKTTLEVAGTVEGSSTWIPPQPCRAILLR